MINTKCMEMEKLWERNLHIKDNLKIIDLREKGNFKYFKK
jgi:hypothetical protein